MNATLTIRCGLLAVFLTFASLTAIVAAPAMHLPARNSFAIKMGAYFPDGDSDLWEFNEQELTTDADDFKDFAFALTYVRQINNHVAVAVDLMFYDGEDESRDRRIGDLYQWSQLSLFPATVSLRLQPGGKYRSGGPGYPGRVRTVVPYLSVGAGLVSWEFEMEGEFEDPYDPDFYFVDRFVSDGVTFGATAGAGLEIDLGGAWSLLVEGNYLWAEDELDDDFEGFDDFDLSGWSALVGASYRF
jgi:hypothetical protein